MKKTHYALIAISSILIITNLRAHGQPGTLDPTFGTGGKVTTAIGNANDAGRAVAITSTGKIVMAGWSENGATQKDFSMVQYNSDGTIDNSFGTNGKVTTDFDGVDNLCNAIALQANGKIILAGSGANYTNDIALARYNEDGTLDTSFGQGGKVVAEIGTGNSAAYSVTVQSDGKILVAGNATNGSDDDFALIRFNSNGTIDSTFDTNGRVITDVGGAGDYALSVITQSDGKIIVGGYSLNGNNYDFAVVRYNADGTLDNTFGTNGKVTTDIGGAMNIGIALAIQQDGKIILAGYSNNGLNYDFALARYNTDGTLDNFFGSSGIVITDFSGGDDNAYSIRIQTDGKIVAAGGTHNGSNFDFGLARYDTNGNLDITFGSGGKVITVFGNGDDIAWSVRIQADSKIVVAGEAYTGPNYDFAVARYGAGNVGIDDISPENSMTVSPNPFSSEIIIKRTEGSGELILFDVVGKEILRQQTFSSETKVNTEKLLPGIYLLNYESGKAIKNLAVLKF